MLMSLLTTTRLCPNCPDDSWGTTSIVAIPTPFWSDPNKVLTGQTPFARKFSEVNCENPLLYASEGGGSNQNGNRKAAGGWPTKLCWGGDSCTNRAAFSAQRPPLTEARTSNSSPPVKTSPDSSCRSDWNRYPRSWEREHKCLSPSPRPAPAACDDKERRAFACRHRPWCRASAQWWPRFSPSVSNRAS